MKRKIVIVNSNYPSETNHYGDVFVHSRLIHYLVEFDVQVLGYNKNADKDSKYIYEGVSVEVVCKKEHLINRIRLHKPDILGFHFIEGWMVNNIVKNFKTTPIFIWIHGNEALGWYRRMFYLEASIKSILGFLRHIISNTIQMVRMRKLINYSNSVGKVNFIFVSNWMKKITETDTLSRIKKFNIIPNPIDSDRFKYVQKGANDRKKVLLIRSFDNKKYANDIAVDAILKLSQAKHIFEDIEFAIYGKGKLFNELIKKVQKFKNVKIINDFIENKDIPHVHRNYGIFLCPTRQDAQGVSMCEAMASGLVPISSNNTAIPEFLSDGMTGFLSESSDDISEKIKYLYQNPEEFLRVSKEASQSIRSISGTISVVGSELSLFYASLEKNGHS